MGARTGVAQTTQGLISGQLVDSVTGRPIPQATVTFSSAITNLAGAAATDESGYYYLPLLSPGIYQIRVTSSAYQAQEVQELELTVAARIELDFRLRPLSDVWESGQYKSVFLPGQKTIVTFYGPDVDPSKSGSFDAQKGRREPLESTVSEVIDSDEINNLPLEGRDVYSLLVTQPGVTSDAATARGLGLSVNGQRPSSSNFLLDGLENNNYLITGPLATVAPEAIQEYRISTNNFSAEYGRTSGFLANAITRTGGEQFHGVAYFYLQNEALNGNAFQQNLIGAPRSIDKQDQPGYFVGGPVLKNRLFFSSAYEYFRSRGAGTPYPFNFPTPNFLNFTGPNSLARQLLTDFPSPITNTATSALTQVDFVAPPVAVNRALAIERMNYNSRDGRERVMGRVLINRLTEPDFIWSPYKDFVSPLHDNTLAAGGSYIHTFAPNLTNEARLSYSTDQLHWNRPHPEIPTLLTGDTYAVDGIQYSGVTLPGSLAFYSYKNHNNSWELLDNLIWTHGRHLVTVGGGALWRSSNGFLDAGQDGQYYFGSVLFFALGQPSFLEAAVDRTQLPTVQQPSPNRSYNYGQDFLFAQDTFKLTPRLTVNYGVRYEFYGGAENTGSVKDALVRLGPGSLLAQQLAGASLVQPSGSGNQQIFGSSNDFEIRAGAAYDLLGNGHTLLRGGFGTFYDRPFDNLWENVRENNIILPVVRLSGQTNFLAPISTELAALQGQTLASSFPDLTLMDPNLRNGRIKSYFAGVQQRITDNLQLEVNGLGSYGRALITTDIVNRAFSTPEGRYNNSLADIAYRANQGFSDYNALTAVVRYRNSRGMIQGSYTWSHAIDNQSDPLVGDFFNLSFTSIQSAAASGRRSTFTEQFDPNIDRGNSDFDQRHNLVVFSYWNLPSPFPGSKAALPLRNWTIAGLAAFRSGLPYTVYGPTSGTILNNRADLIQPNQAVLSNPVPVPGGEQLLNPAAFAPAPAGTVGNLGRNAFIGPGFYSLDLSLARAFPLRWLGESGQLRIRADAYNVLNHANLGNPDAILNDPNFGVATFGRQGYPSGFPAVAPLNETPREIQLSLHIVF
ncbi:MAG TPA: carboxypeptidase regulatory-like domain-containing protein [Bryobacteraceae bacterium]|nr:carboxypeptidase regulatory-like domain-containing protein [Bryobacteraceae bacterium]